MLIPFEPAETLTFNYPLEAAKPFLSNKYTEDSITKVLGEKKEYGHMVFVKVLNC